MRFKPGIILSPDELRILNYAKENYSLETYWTIMKIISEYHQYDTQKIEFTSEEIETLEKIGALKDVKYTTTL